jgi:hypothetical protein
MSIFDGVGIYLGDSIQTWDSKKKDQSVDIYSKLPYAVTSNVPKSGYDDLKYSYGKYTQISTTPKCTDKWTCYAEVSCDS